MKNEVRLEKPLEVVISENIKNPDLHLDNYMSDKNLDPQKMEEIEYVKTLDHDAKVRWILALPSSNRLEPITICTIIIVTTVVEVIIGWYIVDGVKKYIKEKKEVEKEIEKCVPKKNKKQHS